MTTHLDYVTGRFVLSEHLVPAGNQQFYHIYDGDFILGETLIPGLGGGGGLFLDASLDLNFAENLSLVDDVSGNNLITYSRASTGTYVGSDGLIKTSPVNLLTYSNLITSANWTFSKLSAPTSATTEIDSPVSGSSVFKLLETTDTGEHYFRKTSAVLIASSTTVTTSLYINTSLGRSKVRVYSFALNNLTFIWDLVNNAEISLTGGTSATVESTPIGNNWYRLKWTDIVTANNDFKPSIMSVTDSNQFSFAGDTSKGFYITGYQIEEGSTASTYIPTTTTATGAPRFDHDPVTLESLGLLIEESRTNYCIASENPAGWTVTNGASKQTFTAVTAPDGSTLTQGFRLPDSGSRVYPTLSPTGTIVPVSSFYVRSVSGTATLNLFIQGVNVGSNIAVPPDRWIRISGTSASGTFSGFSVRGNSSQSEDVYIWGAQLEAGSFPTSYIPTTSSTVTRAADIASITGTNFSSWYNQSEGTVFVDRTFNANFGHAYYFADSGLTGNRVRLQATTHSGNNLDGSAFNISVIGNKSALGLQTNNISASANGGTVFSDTSYTMPSTFDRLFIGKHATVPSELNGHIARFAYFPTRKTDQQLITITGGTLAPAIITYGITSAGGTFNLLSTGTVDYAVDWDSTGGYEESTLNTLPHTYTAGAYDLVVYSDGVYRPYFNLKTADASQITSVVVGSGADLGTDLYSAWEGGSNLATFTCPFSVTSSVTNFRATWARTALTIFPLIDTSSGTDFHAPWYQCTSLVSFPLLNVSSGVNFDYAWTGCTSLTTFPANMFDTTGTLSADAFNAAWAACALTAQSIENILVSLDTNGATGIILNISGGTNAAKTTWSTAANTAYDNLITKGWTISFNA